MLNNLLKSVIKATAVIVLGHYVPSPTAIYTYVEHFSILWVVALLRQREVSHTFAAVWAWSANLTKRWCYDSISCNNNSYDKKTALLAPIYKLSMNVSVFGSRKHTFSTGKVRDTEIVNHTEWKCIKYADTSFSDTYVGQYIWYSKLCPKIQYWVRNI